MRTPNCSCMVCEKPLYRRPSDKLKFRHFACFEHRGIAQKITGITDNQKQGLKIGQEMKSNGRLGMLHKAETKQKMSKSISAFCRNNPSVMKARGEKTRGELHYRWSGGVSELTQSIRRLDEYRKWAKAVRVRDCKCTECGSNEKLEAHHIVKFSDLVKTNQIQNRDEARNCADLWDINNGKTLCQNCHFKEHGRRFKNR